MSEFETIDDIARDLAGWAELGATANPQMLMKYSDRIKAAVSREREGLHSTIVKMEDAIAKQADAVNAGELRRALEKISKEIWGSIDPTCNDDCCRPWRELARIADAALAAPARNVDTVESLDDFLSEKYQDDADLEVIKEWREDEVAFCLRYPCAGSLLHSLRWLFLSAKEGGAK